MKYKLSSNINISKTEDGGSIVLNSNDAQYYHFDKLTTDFLTSLIAGVILEDFCKNISINYSVDLSQVLKDYKEILVELQQLKILEETK
ncbi:hypothetical protein [Streptococcus suis]|uniref:hypothetical protein n=1 Tax=Streptococcus suis TaxID=1307 RepID=UPI000C1A8926|nr:hypothetical protein [Streptococcus suis]